MDLSTTADAVAAKEAELKAARAALGANFNRYAGTSSMRGKQHGIRVDSQIRRGAELAETVKRLEGELAALRAPKRVAPPLDLTRLPFARYIRTKWGWYEVVRVNRVTVTVATDTGMDDLVKISKILEIREGKR